MGRLRCFHPDYRGLDGQTRLHDCGRRLQDLLLRPAGGIRRIELRPRGGGAGVRFLQHERRARIRGYPPGRPRVFGGRPRADHPQPRLRGCESARASLRRTEGQCGKDLESGRARQVAVTGLALFCLRESEPTAPNYILTLSTFMVSPSTFPLMVTLCPAWSCTLA